VGVIPHIRKTLIGFLVPVFKQRRAGFSDEQQVTTDRFGAGNNRPSLFFRGVVVVVLPITEQGRSQIGSGSWVALRP
jgi:hypothetical protein